LLKVNNLYFSDAIFQGFLLNQRNAFGNTKVKITQNSRLASDSYKKIGARKTYINSPL